MRTKGIGGLVAIVLGCRPGRSASNCFRPTPSEQFKADLRRNSQEKIAKLKAGGPR